MALFALGGMGSGGTRRGRVRSEPLRAADPYGLDLLEAEVQDFVGNRTHFLLLGSSKVGTA